MAKRYTDSNKWDDPWYQELKPEYKLAWDYICDKCDSVGVWKPSKRSIDFHTGFAIDLNDFLMACTDKRIYITPSGNWWIVGFCEFQYGHLEEQSKSAPIISYIKLLKKHSLWEGYIKGIYTLKEKEKDKEEEKDKDKDKDKAQISGNGFEYHLNQAEQAVDAIDEKLKEYDTWTTQIIEGNDQYFEQMFTHESIPAGDHIQFWIMDHRDLLNRYPKMRPPTQDAFRKSCMKHIRENYKKPTNGKVVNKKQQQSDSTSEYLKNYYAEKISGSKANREN